MIEILPNWHPLFVHFTIGLFAMATVFHLLHALAPVSQGLKLQWLTAGRWLLWSGALISVGTVAAGWYAYNTVDHDTPSHAAMTIHRNWALGTVLVIFATAVWSWLNQRNKEAVGAAFLLFMVLGAGLVGVTGWLGGEAVYRYGLGVMSLPKVEAAGHGHHDNGMVDGMVPDETVHNGHNDGDHSH